MNTCKSIRSRFNIQALAQRPLFTLFVLTALAIALFYPRAYAPDSVFAQGAYYDVVVEGQLGAYQIKEDSITLTLKNCRILYENQSFSCTELRVYIAEERMDTVPPLRAGCLLRVAGSLSSFQPARNPGNFDWHAYYLARHISYSVSAKKVTVLRSPALSLQELLIQARRALAERLKLLAASLKSPFTGADTFSPVLRALLLGDKADLDDETEARYETGGILHILSVSGLHVSLLGGALTTLAKRLRLPLWLQKASASAFVLLYWQFCGASLSSGRATVMFLCLSAAPLLGRSYDSLSALSLAGLLLLWDSPGLLFQASFQLSFGSILGILLVCPAFAPPRDAPDTGKAARLFPALRFGLGLQLSLLPITLYHFFRYPLYAILLNLAVLPLTTPLFLCGAAGLLLSFVWLPLGVLFLLPCRLILLLYDLLCRAAAALPMASCLWGRPALPRIFLYYALLALLCILLQASRRNKASQEAPADRPPRLPRKPAVSDVAVTNSKIRRISALLKHPASALLLSAGLLLLVLLLPLPSGTLTVTFLDTGQGDCALLRTPGGTTVLIDGGSSDIRNAAETRLIPFLEAQAVDTLDYVFLSHSDDDHVNTVSGWLASGHGIGCLILPALRDSLAAEESYQALLTMAEAYQVPLLYFDEGSSWSGDGLSLLCLAPAAPDSPDGSRYSSINASSMVLLAEYEGIRFLFTGDCGEEGETMLIQRLRQEDITCHILKAGHHGSASSTTTPLLEQLTPQLVVISCGIRNRYRHPHPDMLARVDEQAVPRCITAQCGAVIVTVQNGKARIRTMLPTGR